jgi:high-affinity K+ transport system ATPase subunit B
MRTDRDALRLAFKILAKTMLVGALFACAAYFLKHAANNVLLVVFLIPVTVGVVLAGTVLAAPRRCAEQPTSRCNE